jgi:hypothetical protein
MQFDSIVVGIVASDRLYVYLDAITMNAPDYVWIALPSPQEDISITEVLCSLWYFLLFFEVRYHCNNSIDLCPL